MSELEKGARVKQEDPTAKKQHGVENANPQRGATVLLTEPPDPPCPIESLLHTGVILAVLSSAVGSQGAVLQTRGAADPLLPPLLTSLYMGQSCHLLILSFLSVDSSDL